jgi:hypothetical protein
MKNLPESEAERRRLAALEAADCPLCDDDGYRGSVVCDHIDHTPAARRGMAKVRLALAKKDRPT